MLAAALCAQRDAGRGHQRSRCHCKYRPARCYSVRCTVVQGGGDPAARAAGQRIIIARARGDEELEAAFALLLREGVGALLVAGDPYFDTRRDRIVAFAARQRLPAIYHFRDYAVAGGLLSYGVSITDTYRQFGLYTAY